MAEPTEDENWDAHIHELVVNVRAKQWFQVLLGLHRMTREALYRFNDTKEKAGG